MKNTTTAFEANHDPTAMAIRMENVTKTYGRQVAVDSLSVHVPKGEVFGFIGPNGAGKTTTIKLLGGILKPDAGRVSINGLDMSADPVAAKRQIGYIPDRPYLYEKLTGMEFLRFTADIYGVNHFDKTAGDLLTLFSLYEWKNELIESYSHGMKQRLIMCSALLHDPTVLIVDEPMVGLDPRAIKLVKNLIRELARKNMAIFMSTHTLQVAQDVCDRIGVIHKSRLVAVGTPTELLKRAKLEQGSLEEIFIRLTGPEETPDAAYSGSPEASA